MSPMTEQKDRKRREFARRLAKAAEYRGLPDHGKNRIISDEFVRRGIKVTPMSVGRWFNATTLPTSSNLQVLAEVLNIQYDWLTTGRGPMVLTEAQDTEGRTRHVVVHELPLLTQDQVFPYLNDEISPAKEVLVAGMLGRRAFVYRLKGQSLTPAIAPGALLVIDPDQPSCDGVPWMAVDGDLAIFGNPVRSQDSMILEPINSQYPIQTVPLSAVVGPVVALAQQFLTTPQKH